MDIQMTVCNLVTLDSKNVTFLRLVTGSRGHVVDKRHKQGIDFAVHVVQHKSRVARDGFLDFHH